MGSKSEAKKIMEKAKVPLVPGYHGDDQSPELYNKFMLPPRIPDIPIPVLLPGTGASIQWGVKEALPTSVNGDVYSIVDRALGSAGEATAMAKGVLVCGPEISNQLIVVVGSSGSGP